MIIQKKYIIPFIILLLLITENINILLSVNLIAFFYFILKGRVQKKTGILISFLIIPVLLATIHGLFYYPKYDVFKDTYYLLNPILFIILGIVIAQHIDPKALFKTIIIAGSIYSLIHIIKVFLFFGVSAFNDFRLVRYEIGGGHIITTIAFVLCIFSLYVYKLNLFNSRTLTKLFIGLNCLSLLFSGSRTYIVIFIILILAVIYPYYRHRLFGFLITLSAIILIFVILIKNNPENEFVKKILDSTTELKIGDYNNFSDQNNKYRGWETYRAFITYSEGNTFQLIFGHGAGKMIDLGTYFNLSKDESETVRYIPILHNGYLYALVKAGMIGIICYLFYFIYFVRDTIKKLAQNDIQINFQSYFLIGILISIYFCNVIISGLYNTTVELLGVISGSLFYHLLNSQKTNQSL